MGIIQTQIEPLCHLLLLPCYTIDRHGKIFFSSPACQREVNGILLSQN